MIVYVGPWPWSWLWPSQRSSHRPTLSACITTAVSLVLHSLPTSQSAQLSANGATSVMLDHLIAIVPHRICCVLFSLSIRYWTRQLFASERVCWIMDLLQWNWMDACRKERRWFEFKEFKGTQLNVSSILLFFSLFGRPAKVKAQLILH